MLKVSFDIFSKVWLEGNDKREENLCFWNTQHKSKTKLLVKKSSLRVQVSFQTVEVLKIEKMRKAFASDAKKKSSTEFIKAVVRDLFLALKKQIKTRFIRHKRRKLYG